MKIRILLADDHPIVRDGLRAVLSAEPDFAVVGECGSGDEAVRLATRLRPDLVLMDLRMPGLDGVAATRAIVAAPPHSTDTGGAGDPDEAERAKAAEGGAVARGGEVAGGAGRVRVLVLTTYDTDTDILGAVEAGATGYLLKDTPRRELAEAVRNAAAGRTVLAPPVAARLVTPVGRSGHATLTRREIEVLGCVARGLSNRKIARELFVGETTVKTHLLRAFAKLGVGDRTAAVTTAITRGILPCPAPAAPPVPPAPESWGGSSPP
jgi:DNA-binding NarL/FixJ family response regulator